MHSRSDSEQAGAVAAALHLGSGTYSEAQRADAASIAKDILFCLMRTQGFDGNPRAYLTGAASFFRELATAIETLRDDGVAL